MLIGTWFRTDQRAKSVNYAKPNDVAHIQNGCTAPNGIFWIPIFNKLTHTGPALSCHKWTGVGHDMVTPL